MALPFMRLRYLTFACSIAIATVAFQIMPWSQAQRPTPEQPEAVPPVEMELPTDEDRQAAAEFRKLITSLDTETHPVRELLNGHRRDIREALQALESTVPISRRTLSRARRFLRRIQPDIEEAGTLKPPAPYYIAQRRGKLTIDGKLDEAAWQHAAVIPIQFHRMTQIEEPAAVVRLLWDSQYLYAAFTVPDNNIVAPLLERDGPVWENDCVELFLMPDPNSNVYWEVEISPTGSILDYLCYKHQSRWGSDFKEEETMHGLQAVSTIRGTANQEDDVDKGYLMEIAIPFDQLPGMSTGPKTGDRMAGLLCQISRDGSGRRERTTALAQVPYVGWFHNVWAYQPFVFVDKVPK